MLIDEAGLFLNPLVRRTWARRGQTPVLDGWGRHRDRVSVIGAITLSPVARRLGFYFATDPAGFFNAERVAGFLRDLLRHLRGKIIVVWDGGTNHQGPAIGEVLRRYKRLRLVRLPAYAPDLNPVEAVWSWLKYSKLANFVPADVDELDEWVMEYLTDLQDDRGLLARLWRGSELPFPIPILQQPRLPADQYTTQFARQGNGPCGQCSTNRSWRLTARCALHLKPLG